MRILTDEERCGEWPAAIAASISATTTILPGVANQVLQIGYIRLGNTTAVTTTLRLEDTSGALLLEAVLDKEGAFPIPAFSLERGRGLVINLNGANLHHYSVLARYV